MRRILLTLLIAILSVPIAWADETGGATVVRAEYFFDSDPGYGNATIINNVTEGDNNLSLSVERLSPGAHMLYVRSQASTGVWSSTQSHPLLILRQRPTEAVRVEYFYDTDPGYGNGKSVGNLTDGDNTLVVSVAGLAYGVHHLCLRAQDNTGVWSQVATSSIFVTSPQTANAIRVEYFFDTDPGFGQGTPITPSQDETATYALSLDGLSMGAHVLNLRVQDNHGRWSAVQQHPIYVLSNLPDVVAAEYFFDNNDPGEGQATAVPLPSAKTDPFAFEANTAGLAPGEHHLMVRLKKNNGFWTLYDAATFTVDGPAEPEPYAVLTDNTDVLDDPVTGITYGKTLMFYYDTEKQARGGMDIGPFEADSLRGWHQAKAAITKVIFASSFANDTTVTSTAYWFQGCNNLTSIENIQNLKTDRVTNMSWMFASCMGLTSLDVSGFNTAHVTDMSWMFHLCSGLTYLDVSNFKTDNVTSMAQMFSFCNLLHSLDVSGFNTANVTDMSWLFYSCSGLTSLDVSGFNTANVTNMNYMFTNCSGLTSLDVSNFKTDNVTDMSIMFTGCSGLSSLDVSGFNTANVTDMSRMFSGCFSLSSLDVSNFNTANVTNMSWMFNGCSGLTSLDLSNFNTANVTDMSIMFRDCSELTTIYAGSEWSTDSVTNSEDMFAGCTKLVGGKGTVFDADHIDKAYAHIDGGASNPGYFTDKNAPVVTEPEPYAVLADNTLTFYYDTKKEERGGLSVDPFAPGANGNWSGDQSQTTIVFDDSFANCTTITHTANWFAGFQHLETIVGIENLNTENVTNMENMFSACTMLTSLDLSHFNTEKVTNMESMFWACGALTNLDVTSFNTSNVTNMEGMFYGCGSLTSLDVSSFNTSKVTDMKLMFGDCFNLTNLNLSSFNTENVTDMSEMFYRCGALTSLDVTNFNTANVTTMYNMFMGCGSLTSLDVSHFNTANVTNMESMFADCSGLKTLDLSSFNTAKVEYTQNMFRDCAELTTIFAGDEWTMAAVTWGPGMFSNCDKLVGGKGTTYDADHIDETYAHIDGGPSNPGYFTDKNAPVVPDPEPYVVLDSTTMTFYYDTEMNSRQGMPIVAGGATVTWGNYAGGITNVVFTSSFAEYLPVSTASWFSGFKSLTTITGIENLKTDSVKSMRSMFQGCASLIHVDMSQFNTSKVEDYGNIFNGCSSLAAIQAGYAMIPAEEYARVDNPNLLLYVNEPSLAPQSVQNVVVRDFAKTIILTDEVGTSGNNNFYAPKSFTAEMISYSHEYRQQTVNGISRGWESIVLPFTVQTIVNERNGVIAPFGNAASELHFWLRQLISDGIVRATQIEANKAYIISMPNNEEEYPAKYNQNGRVTFSSENALVPATVIEGVEGKIASGELVTLMPNFQKKYANENFYALNVGEERLYNGTSYPEGSVFERGYRAVRPFEAYTIHHGSSPAPQFISIADITNGDNLTGINDAIRLNDEQLINDKWYDLNGQQLQKKPTRKGVYLHNGRKVIIR